MLSYVKPHASAAAASTFSASSVTSGPVPSPPITAILYTRPPCCTRLVFDHPVDRYLLPRIRRGEAGDHPALAGIREQAAGVDHRTGVAERSQGEARAAPHVGERAGVEVEHGLVTGDELAGQRRLTF